MLLLLLLLLLKDHQDIKSRDQDTKTRQGGGVLALLCLLAWMDGSCSDGSCLLGLDRKIQFRIVKDTPRCDKSNIINRKEIQYILQYIFVLHQSIFMRKKHFQISYSKTFFKKFFHL
uniref:Putative secreted protein n=1 Tax=Rhipicephalus microplus TaxID=6941 RepID=A0A6G5A1M9_RHIMP